MSEELNYEKPSLIGMITNPIEQFTRIKERPIFGVAICVVTILIVIGMWMNIAGVDIAELDEVQGLTEGEIVIVEAIAKITFVFAGILGPILGVLVSSAVYLLVAKIVESSVTFRQLFSLNTYIMIITAVGSLINGIIFTIVGGNQDKMFTSLGVYVKADGATEAVFDSIEIFSIWGLVLTAIGLQKVAGFSKTMAWGISIILFVVGVIFAMMGAGLEGMV